MQSTFSRRESEKKEKKWQNKTDTFDVGLMAAYDSNYVDIRSIGGKTNKIEMEVYGFHYDDDNDNDNDDDDESENVYSV